MGKKSGRRNTWRAYRLVFSPARTLAGDLMLAPPVERSRPSDFDGRHRQAFLAPVFLALVVCSAVNTTVEPRSRACLLMFLRSLRCFCLPCSGGDPRIPTRFFGILIIPYSIFLTIRFIHKQKDPFRNQRKGSETIFLVMFFVTAAHAAFEFCQTGQNNDDGPCDGHRIGT